MRARLRNVMTRRNELPNRSLADLLGHLFAMARRPDGAEWTGKDVVATVRARGVELSESHLSELRRGVKTNPTMRVLLALAELFEVPVAYLSVTRKRWKRPKPNWSYAQQCGMPKLPRLRRGQPV